MRRRNDNLTMALRLGLAGLGASLCLPSLALAAPPEEDGAADTADADADADASADDPAADDAGEGDAAEDEAADAGDVEDVVESDPGPEGPAAAESATGGDAAEGDADVEDAAAGEDGEDEDADEDECDCTPPEPPPADPTHITEFTASAGGLLTTGNANTLAVTGKAATTIRRGKHQYTGTLDGNYGQSRADLDSEWLPTTTNVEGKARYDGFFVDWASGFVGTTARHDPFQGLNVRWTLDPGVTFYAVQTPMHNLRFDVGYQLQVDARRRGAILLKDDDGNVIIDTNGDPTRDPELDEIFVNHSLRLAGNYDIKVNDSVKWRIGTEYVQSLIIPDESDRWRLNADTGIDVSLVAGLGLGFSFQLRYDNKPLPEVKKLDTFSNVTLTYTFKAPAKK